MAPAVDMEPDGSAGWATPLMANLPKIILVFIFVPIISRFLHGFITQYFILRHIPGPFGSGWSRLFIIRSTYKNTLHLDFAAAIKKYGISAYRLAGAVRC